MINSSFSLFPFEPHQQEGHHTTHHNQGSEISVKPSVECPERKKKPQRVQYTFNCFYVDSTLIQTVTLFSRVSVPLIGEYKTILINGNTNTNYGLSLPQKSTIEVLLMTQDTASMADCSNIFNKSIVATYYHYSSSHMNKSNTTNGLVTTLY